MNPFTFVRLALLWYVGMYAYVGTIPNMDSTGFGINLMSKYCKIVGPLGQTREAFEEKEVEEKDEEEKGENDKTFDYEAKLLKEEENYLGYLEQLRLARYKGQDPSKVTESEDAKKFEALYRLNEPKGRRRKYWKSKPRTKRFAVEDSDRYWTTGTVPYIFSKTLTDADILGKIRAKNRFHYWTCVRFVPLTKTTKEEHNLNHNNYLVHIKKNGCWSFVGNMRMEGQKISCCKDATCVHELGHALGLHHEQKSPIHDDYLRINEENIDPEKVSGYNEVEPIESRMFGYFDMASAMLYNKYIFSNNGMPTMTVFDSRMEYLMNNPDPHLFYMFREITMLYNCTKMKCQGKPANCKNGYPAFIRDSCTCRCPRGLDPASGCSTVYRGDKNLKKMSWPHTAFSMIKPKEGCPREFNQGSVIQYVKNGRVSNTFNSDIGYHKDHFDFEFCTRNEKIQEDKVTEWEPGEYCILSHDSGCPQGFQDGYIQFGGSRAKVISYPIPDGRFDSQVVWHFCCREDGTSIDPLYLPTRNPFTLFPKDDKCQQVKDMRAELQWFMVQTNDISATGSLPSIRIVKEKSVYIEVCYYWPVNYNCGGVINLSPKNPVAVIKSPNYPKPYNSKQQCSWTVEGPINTKIKLDFEAFDIHPTVIKDTAFPTCDDSLEIRSTLPGQPGINYCGNGFQTTVISEMNYLGITLASGLKDSNQGFKAVVKLISDKQMCYTNKGEDYRGRVNVTSLFEPCLPWTRVQHCPHHTFHPGDLDDDLVDNYCRNPGSGTRPWCYTHYEDCNRNYCDACGLENCYDLLEDCKMLLSADTTFCHSNIEAHRICRQSCGFCEKKIIQPVSKIRCSTPPKLEDAVSTDRLRRRYKVGDVVTFKCRDGYELDRRTCLADGSWSGGNFVCGRCPKGWIPHKRNCYRWFNSYENWKGSTDICRRYSSVIAESNQLSFLLKLRKDMRPFWLNLTFDDGTANTIQGNRERFGFKNKNSGCGYVDKTETWNEIPCDSVLYLAVICKLSPSERLVCRDARDNCEDFIHEEPGACKLYPDFAWHVCPRSCYQCDDGTESRCSFPPTPANVRTLSKFDELYPGMMIEYECKNGYILTNGNLRRTCLLSDSLTGSAPVCQDRKTVPVANNEIELRERSQDGSGGSAYTAENEAMRIKKSGKIVRWEFYSVYDGKVTFQVWRKTSQANRYRLIGQNRVKSTGMHRTRNIEIPTPFQINVIKGDLIGFYLPRQNKGGITFDKCVTKHTFGDFGKQKIISEKKRRSIEWKVGSNYQFKQDKPNCKIVSLRAYVL